MRFFINSFFCICVIFLAACSKRNIIELQLRQQDGYGNLPSSSVGISPYAETENNPWEKTYLLVTGVPENWTNIKYGDIETNIYQSVYQDFIAGNITEEFYLKLQKSWDWKPDTLELSKEPLRTKIAFAVGENSLGILNVIVDANNNLDFTDDKAFVPFNYEPSKMTNIDSIALNKTINVSFERYIHNKKHFITAPLFMAQVGKQGMLLGNFPQHSITDFKGKKIVISSDGFTNLSYKNINVAVVGDTIKAEEKINPNLLIAKNEFVEVKGKIYKNIGVNTNKNALMLEKVSTPKSELHSTQIGYKSFEFEGNDFTSAADVSSNNLKGKYVLLDFWAVWCAPCLQEFPHLKKLYDNTDRKKFEIIGVIGDSPSKAIKKVIEKHSIVWPQILSTDFNKIKEVYGVYGYPMTFLLDPEGVIIAKNLRGKELEEKVLGLID